MPAIAVQEVATFYTMYNHAGRQAQDHALHQPAVPAARRRLESAAEYLKQKLGIDFGETTADGKFTLKEGECMGACGDAPVMLVNNKRMCSFMAARRSTS